VQIPEGLPMVLTDPMLLQSALEALLANALLYVAPGQQPAVAIGVESAVSRYRIVVQDCGIGIAEEQLERIFLPFVRLHRRDEYPGSGMGLAIVRRISELLRASVGVESVRGQGSRFWIEVDAAP
jgi:signal transduction histidine kinase